jgi:hypothetical protein
MLRGKAHCLGSALSSRRSDEDLDIDLCWAAGAVLRSYLRAELKPCARLDAHHGLLPRNARSTRVPAAKRTWRRRHVHNPPGTPRIRMDDAVATLFANMPFAGIP